MLRKMESSGGNGKATNYVKSGSEKERNRKVFMAKRNCSQTERTSRSGRECTERSIRGLIAQLLLGLSSASS